MGDGEGRWAAAAVCGVLVGGCADAGRVHGPGGGGTDGDTFGQSASGAESGENTADDDEEDSGSADESSSSGGDTWDKPDGAVPYNEASFAATHNSYSGAFADGDVGTIRDQLEAGFRFVELDVHTDDFETAGFRVGHDEPGHEVALGNGNPDSEALPAWIDVVAQWSDDNPDHAPITLMIDLKDNPKGDFAGFNELMLATFGRDRLFTPDDLGDAGAWPLVDALRGRVILVLSGDEDGQLAYRRDRGIDPAIAINASGQVIEVHTSEANGDDLWLWTGQVTTDGDIDWIHHSKYDTGEHPAVALRDDGLIVEVHEDHDSFDDDLWYRVGRLGDDYTVAWSTTGGQHFPNEDEGERPSIAFADDAGTTVREVHKSQTNDQRWYWFGESIDEASGTIVWSRPDGDGQTDDGFYPTTTAEHDGMTYEVQSTTSGPHDKTLVVQGAFTRRVRYRQLAFGSARASSKDALMNDGLQFFADDAGSDSGRDFVRQKQAQGLVTRLWHFNEPLKVEEDDGPPLTFAASDVPFADWYADYCEAAGCAR